MRTRTFVMAVGGVSASLLLVVPGVATAGPEPAAKPVIKSSGLAADIVKQQFQALLAGGTILMAGKQLLAFGKDTVALPAFTGVKPILALGAAIAPQSLWVLAVTLALLAGLKVFFTATIQGKQTITAAEYEAGVVYDDAICHAFYQIDEHLNDGRGINKRPANNMV